MPVNTYDGAKVKYTKQNDTNENDDGDDDENGDDAGECR